MVWINWQSVGRYGAIATLAMAGVACQPAAEPPSDPEAAAPSETAPADPASSPAESPTADNATPETADPAGSTIAATPEQSCSTAAYVVDTDPAGLNVRQGPSSDFAIQDTLPTDVPVEVSLVGATGEWFLINAAWSQEQPELERPGWVYGPLLGVSTTSLNVSEPDAPTSLYAAPDGDAAIAATIPKGTAVTLRGCSGNWLQVEAPTATGWLAVGEQCSNPVSTCP